MRKDRYVVGYRAADNCVYGKEPPHQNISPMTLARARRELRDLTQKGATIFKLVPVRNGGR